MIEYKVSYIINGVLHTYKEKQAENEAKAIQKALDLLPDECKGKLCCSKIERCFVRNKKIKIKKIRR